MKDASYFFSRKNLVRRLPEDHGWIVEKQFSDPLAADREEAVYAMLKDASAAVPQWLGRSGSRIYLSYLPGLTACELLEQEEQRQASDLSVWLQLTDWCCCFYRTAGLCLGDPNPRNFIFDAEQNLWYGIDFEDCRPGDCTADFAALLAFLLLQRPEQTAFKTKVTDAMAELFCRETGASPSALHRQCQSAIRFIQARRKNRKDR